MNDLMLPPDYPTVPQQVYDDMKLVKLAREIAMDVADLETILSHHKLEPLEFERLRNHPRFVKLLAAEVEAWNSAVNTNERVKLKAAAAIEEWMPELYARMNDRQENLLAKIKGGELLTKLAGLGVMGKDELSASDRVSITINLGADNKLQVTKELQPKVIEHNIDQDEPPHED